MADMTLIKKFADTLKETGKGTEPYDTPAEVVRIEGNTAWVHIPGGVDETPVQLTVNAEEGDTVQVRVGGGSAWITGNASAPPTDDKTANAAKQTAEEAQEAAVEASDTATRAARNADSAIKIAGNTAQYFWHTEEGTDTGAHITEIPMEEFLEDPENGGGNLLARSNGIAIRDGLKELAVFAADFLRIGDPDKSHLMEDYRSLQLVDKGGYTYFYVSDLRDAEGYADLSESFTGDGSTKRFRVQFVPSSVTSVTVDGVSVEYVLQAGLDIVLSTAPTDGSDVKIEYKSSSMLMKAYTVGIRAASFKVGAMSYAEGYTNGAEGAYSHAEGSSSHAKGNIAHAEGHSTIASGYCAHSQNEGTTASGRGSHAEGYHTTSSSPYSHAEGYQTTASGSTGERYPAHAEGQETTANGYGSHAEGYKTTSSGPLSHAQNNNTVASGTSSHAQNTGTIAASTSQTALGKYNVQDSNGQYAVIVGNGTADSSRSNALTLKWNGDLKSAGEIEDGNGTSISDLLANFTDFFKVKEYTYAYSNLNAGAGLNITATNFGFSRPTGYVPIAFLRTNSGSVNVSVIGANVQATGSVAAMSIYNHSSAARSYTASITVLYARSSMVTTV